MSGEDAVYELTVDQPNLPKGELVQIPGLGTFENGGTYTVSKEEAEGYRTYHSKVEPVVNEDDGAVVGSQVVSGPTLLQASKNMYGIEVSTTDKDHKESPKAVTTTSPDTSKATPNEKQVELQNEKPQSAAEGTKTKSTEGGAN